MPSGQPARRRAKDSPNIFGAASHSRSLDSAERSQSESPGCARDDSGGIPHRPRQTHVARGLLALFFFFLFVPEVEAERRMLALAGNLYRHLGLSVFAEKGIDSLQHE